MIDIKPDSYLMHAIGFTADDLADNRGGKLSEAQQKKYKHRESNGVNITTAVVTKHYEIRHKRGEYYHLRFNNQEILVSAEAYYAFIQDQHYTLYYNSNRLIAAEYADKPLLESYHNVCLMNAFEIGPKELDVNRDGQLTTSQINLLQRKNRNWLLTFVAVFICLVLAVLGLSLNEGRWWESAFDRFFIILPMGMILVAGAFSDRARRGWQQGQVAVVRGVVTHRYDDLGSLLVDGERAFALRRRAFAFIPGETYTLYYVPYRTFFFDHFDPIVAAEHHPVTLIPPEEAPAQQANPLTTPSPHN